MRQRLALVAVEKDDIAGFGLALAQLQPQADPIHLARGLGVPSGCAAAAVQRKFFFATPWIAGIG